MCWNRIKYKRCIDTQCNALQDFCICAGKQNTLDSWRIIPLMKCCIFICLFACLLIIWILLWVSSSTVFLNPPLYILHPCFSKKCWDVIFISNKEKTSRIHLFYLSACFIFSFPCASFRKQQLFHILYHMTSFLISHFRASFLSILRDAEETYQYFAASFSLHHHELVICHLCGAALYCQRNNLINFY